MGRITKATDKSTPIGLLGHHLADLNQDLANKKKYAETLPTSKKTNIIVLTKMPEPVPNTKIGNPSFDNMRTSMAG